MKVWSLVAMLALLAGASAASAQTLYKSVMPDGRVIYGDDPEYNAKQVGKIKPPPEKTGTVLPRSGASESRMMMSYAASNGGAHVAVLGGGNGSSGGRRPSVRYCP